MQRMHHHSLVTAHAYQVAALRAGHHAEITDREAKLEQAIKEHNALMHGSDVKYREAMAAKEAAVREIELQHAAQLGAVQASGARQLQQRLRSRICQLGVVYLRGSLAWACAVWQQAVMVRQAHTMKEASTGRARCLLEAKLGP